MALTPLFTRQTSAADLEAAINVFLTGLALDSTINGVEIEQARNEPAGAQNLFSTISADPGAGSAAAAHYVFTTFTASSEDDCILLVNAFIAANPTWFFSPVFGVYRPTNVNPQVGVTLGIFSNTDAVNGAANWLAGGGSGGGSASVLYGNVAWVDAVNGNDATAVVGRFDLPYLTINAAVAAVSAGQVVHVRPGDYTASGTLSKDNISIYCDSRVTISYNTTLFQTLTNNASFRFRGYATLVATGSSARLLNVSGGTGTSFYLEFASHSASAAMSSFGTLINGSAQVTLFIRENLAFNCSSGGVAFGNSFTGARFVGVIFGALSNSGTGYAFQVRQAGAGGSAFLKATTISATGGGAAVSNDQVSSTFYIEADTIAGNSAGLSSTSSGTMIVRAKTISASAGPGITCTSSGTISVNGCDSISGTTAGVNISSGSVNLVGVRAITGTAGPALSVSGGSLLTVGCDGLTGTTFGIQVTGGTTTVGVSSVTGSAGPGISVTTGTCVGQVIGAISGTSSGVITNSGTLQISAGSISASSGPAVSGVSGTCTVNVQRGLTGTTSCVNISGATAVVRGGSATASSGPGYLISAGTLSSTMFDTVQGSTIGVSLTGTGTLNLTCRNITGLNGAGVSLGASAVGGNLIDAFGTISGTTSGFVNSSTTGTATNSIQANTISASAGPAVITTACTHTNDFSNARIVTTNAATAAITHNTATGTGALKLRSCALVATGANSITTSTVGATVLVYGNGSSANAAVAGTVTQTGGALVVNAALT